MLIAVDTNVLIDQALGEEDVLDAIRIIRQRIPQAQFVVTRTVIEELTWATEAEPHTEKGKASLWALQCLAEWGYQAMDVVPVGRGIVEQISRELRKKEVLPDEEENDASLLAEAALLGCKILMTTDSHLLEAQEHPALREVLEYADVAGDDVVIARPRIIARKFDKKQ